PPTRRRRTGRGRATLPGRTTRRYPRVRCCGHQREPQLCLAVPAYSFLPAAAPHQDTSGLNGTITSSLVPSGPLSIANFPPMLSDCSRIERNPIPPVRSEERRVGKEC